MKLIIEQVKLIQSFALNNRLEENNKDYNSNLLELQDICSQIKDYDELNADIDEYIEEFKKENVYKYRNLEFGKNLIKILDIYTDKEWRSEPLDSDEVDILVEHLRNQLDLINGNITNEEYNKLENK